MGMRLNGRLRTLERRLPPEPPCGHGASVEYVELRPGDPEPEPLPPCPCGRVRRMIVHLPDDGEAA